MSLRFLTFQIWDDGAIYEGYYEDGLRNGLGRYIHFDGKMKIRVLIKKLGNWYEGEFKNCEYNGYGKYTWANGDVYTGQFKDDKRHGKQ